MKTLSKKERKEIYLKVAEVYIDGNKTDALCYSLLDEAKIGGCSNVASEVFHEFALFKPRKNERGSYWFSGEDADDRRILVMLFCAAMCD